MDRMCLARYTHLACNIKCMFRYKEHFTDAYTQGEGQFMTTRERGRGRERKRVNVDDPWKVIKETESRLLVLERYGTCINNVRRLKLLGATCLNVTKWLPSSFSPVPHLHPSAQNSSGVGLWQIPKLITVRKITKIIFNTLIHLIEIHNLPYKIKT